MPISAGTGTPDGTPPMQPPAVRQLLGLATTLSSRASLSSRTSARTDCSFMAGDSSPLSDITFLGGNARLARYVGRPVKRFLDIEAASGILLLLVTVVALVWANSPWGDSYTDFWHTEIELIIGDFHVGENHHLDLGVLVNDALMVIFFFVVGLEIKRELVTGQLRDPKAAALPAFAALGGMVVPAVLYYLFNSSGEASSGWGIPMATDIAFAVGVVSLLGPKVPRTLKVFLLTLAIVDDIGAILVIAVFYSEGVQWGWLTVAGATVIAIRVLRRLQVWYIPVYVVMGLFLWFATFESGIHATIAGVILGLITPAKPLQSKADTLRWAQWLRDKDENIYPSDIRYAGFHMKESISVAERLETALHPISSFLIIPIFALANAGVDLGGGKLGDAASSNVTLGVVIGLVAGKTVGVFLFTSLGALTPFASIPREMTKPHLLGLSVVSGIGFTVSLFVASLAFDTGGITDEAKIGILIASLVAGILGLVILNWAGNRALPATGRTAQGAAKGTAGR